VSPLDNSGSHKQGVSFTYKKHDGYDAEENFVHFGEEFFIVKRNLRRECPEQWLATARRVGDLQESRDGKNVYTGFVDHLCPGGAKSAMSPVPVAFEVIARSRMRPA